MGWTSLGSFGSANNKALSATLTFSPNATCAAGNLLVCFTAWDNNNNLSTDGPLSHQMSCVDSVGNIWVEIMSAQGASASNRAHGAMFVSYLDTALTAGDTITLQYLSSKVAKTASLWGFSLGAGERWASANCNFLTTIGAQPGTISQSGFDNLEYLWLYVLAIEAPSTESISVDGNYTPITQDGTTGGADDTNMTVAGGYRVMTGTSESVTTVDNTSSARDSTQGLIALRAFTLDTAFPTQPILDDFNRADESPLSDGGAWDTTCLASESTNTKLQVASNQCQPTAGTNGGQQWIGDMGNETDVYATLATSTTGASNGWGVKSQLTGCGQPAVNTLAGNGATWFHNDTVSSAPDMLAIGGGGDTFNQPANGIDHNRERVIAYINYASGYKLGVQRRGNVISGWIDTGSGWRWVASSYDAGHTSGRLGLLMRGTAGRVDDFGGGGVASNLHLLPVLGVGS